MNKKLPMIIHCSTDEVFCRNGDHETKVPYSNLERTLPGIINTLIEEYNPSSIVIINGPGGFSVLRIGTLCVSMAAKQYHLPIYNWTKIALYKGLYTKKILPKNGYIGIGQRKNIWIYNFESMKSILITAGTDHKKPENYFIDMFSDHVIIQELDSEKMIKLYGSVEGLLCNFQGEESLLGWDSLCSKDYEVMHVSPNYMIEPTLS